MRGVSAAASGNQSTRLSSRIRDIADRLSRLEKKKAYSASSVTIGLWKITTNDAGQLVATSITTGQTTTLAP